MHRSKRTREGGAVLIEAAVVMPILIMLVLGIWSVGRAYNIYLTMDHAAREAARFGAVNADDASWKTEVRNKAINEASPSITLNATNVCVALVDGLAGNPGDCLDSTDDPRTEKRGQVLITKQVPLDFLFFNMNVTLHARAVSRWEAGTT
ncbi:MAG: TadE/TadG family type IV pilus assembly protein [Acidimicrobiia bacterium]